MKKKQSDGFKIIIVEDDPRQARALGDAIGVKFPGATIREIATESEFLSDLDALEKQPPAVLIFDMMLPWCSLEDIEKGALPHTNPDFRTAGLRCAKAALARKALADVPMIFHTPLSIETFKGEFVDMPSNVAFVRKDVGLDNLLLTIRSFLFGAGAHGSALDAKDIFVVHGHDDEAKETVARFIEKLGGRAVVLHEQPNAGRTVIEKFEQHANVVFAIVLLTPDDVGGKSAKSLKQRARQNVVFELGFFFAKLGRNRVCALHKEEVEIPSDIQGVIYTPMDKAGAWRMALIRELKAAAIPLDYDKAI